MIRASQGDRCQEETCVKPLCLLLSMAHGLLGHGHVPTQCLWKGLTDGIQSQISFLLESVLYGSAKRTSSTRECACLPSYNHRQDKKQKRREGLSIYPVGDQENTEHRGVYLHIITECGCPYFTKGRGSSRSESKPKMKDHIFITNNSSTKIMFKKIQHTKLQ